MSAEQVINYWGQIGGGVRGSGVGFLDYQSAVIGRWIHLGSYPYFFFAFWFSGWPAARRQCRTIDDSVVHFHLRANSADQPNDRLSCRHLGFCGSRKRMALRRDAEFPIRCSRVAVLKAASRTFELLPDWGNPTGPLLHTTFLLLLFTGLFRLGSVVRQEENNWAETAYEPRSSSFDAFNNPEHDWNKTKAER